MDSTQILTWLLGGSAVATFAATLVKVWTDNSKLLQQIARLDARVTHLEGEIEARDDAIDNWRRIYSLLLDKHLRLRVQYQRKTGEELPELELPEME